MSRAKAESSQSVTRLAGSSQDVAGKSREHANCHSVMKTKTTNIAVEPRLSSEDHGTEFIPMLRSGAWSDIGFRLSMENLYVCVNDFTHDYSVKNFSEGPNAFFGVFDGHGGKHSANFASNHLPTFIVEDEDFPIEIERVVAPAFLQTDTAFAEACSLDAALAYGTTALAALVVGSFFDKQSYIKVHYT
ncbi:probable protein phosphatase 2C 22 [Actinidia eriantha]|uniref:probable protein phosphatase 2C 22 n=1 Tax=Actinidia eriantha TaxID=165200 RepID=UPI0025841E9D|nr:probable protein phosphatase 2C 22 [Actinidia eriantha]